MTALTAWSQALKETTETILGYLAVTATVTIREEGTSLWVEIETADSALLIGYRGATLQALEYLIRSMVFSHVDRAETVPEIHLDVGGYKTRQHEALIALAREQASKVRKSATPAILRPMNAFERRIIHVALADNPDVVTESIGTGPNRRIIIKPKAEESAADS